MLIDKKNGILSKAKDGLRRFGQSIPIIRNLIKAPENSPSSVQETQLQHSTTATPPPDKPKGISGKAKAMFQGLKSGIAAPFNKLRGKSSHPPPAQTAPTTERSFVPQRSAPESFQPQQTPPTAHFQPQRSSSPSDTMRMSQEMGRRTRRSVADGAVEMDQNMKQRMSQSRDGSRAAMEQKMRQRIKHTSAGKSAEMTQEIGMKKTRLNGEDAVTLSMAQTTKITRTIPVRELSSFGFQPTRNAPPARRNRATKPSMRLKTYDKKISEKEFIKERTKELANATPQDLRIFSKQLDSNLFISEKFSSEEIRLVGQLTQLKLNGKDPQIGPNHIAALAKMQHHNEMKS